MQQHVISRFMYYGAIVLIVSALFGAPPLFGQSKIKLEEDRVVDESQENVEQFGRNVLLTATVWDVDLNPRPTITEQRLRERLVERARIGISGMIYGYRFDYTLENKERNITEQFALSLVSTIPRNDPNLRLVTYWKQGEMLYGQFQYRATGEQLIWLSAWHNSPTVVGGGRGGATVWSSDDEQQTALFAALRDAVTRHLRKQYRDKPKRVTGSLLIRDGTRIWIASGEYRAELFTRIRIEEVEEFEYF